MAERLCPGCTRPLYGLGTRCWECGWVPSLAWEANTTDPYRDEREDEGGRGIVRDEYPANEPEPLPEWSSGPRRMRAALERIAALTAPERYEATDPATSAEVHRIASTALER